MSQQRPRKNSGTAKLKHHKINLPRTTRPGQELRLGSGWIPQAMNSSGTRSTHRWESWDLRSGVLLWTWLAPRGAQPFHQEVGGATPWLTTLTLRVDSREVGSTLDYHREGLLRPKAPQAAPCMGSRDGKSGDWQPDQGPGCGRWTLPAALPTPGLLPPLNTGVPTEHHTSTQRSAVKGSAQGPAVSPAQPSCAWTVGRGPWGGRRPCGRAPGAEARAWGWYAAVLWSAGSKDSAERL